MYVLYSTYSLVEQRCVLFLRHSRYYIWVLRQGWNWWWWAFQHNNSPHQKFHCWVSPASLTLRLRGFNNFLLSWKTLYVCCCYLTVCVRLFFAFDFDFCKNCSEKGPGFFQFLQKVKFKIESFAKVDFWRYAYASFSILILTFAKIVRKKVPAF